MDDKRQLVDNTENNQDVIGGIRVQLPLNRNLSWQLFGQLHNILERNSWYQFSVGWFHLDSELGARTQTKEVARLKHAWKHYLTNDEMVCGPHPLTRLHLFTSKQEMRLGDFQWDSS